MKNSSLTLTIAVLLSLGILSTAAQADDDIKEMEAISKGLGFITLEQASAKALAAKAGVSKQAMSKAVKELQEMSFVKVEKHPKDARSIKVKVTAGGIDFLYAWKNCVIFIEGEFASIIGEQKVTQLKEILGEVVDFYDQSHRDNFADLLAEK